MSSTNSNRFKDGCDLDKVNSIIENLCDLYSKKIVYGSLCNNFCNKKKSYKLIKCYNNYRPEDFKDNGKIEQKYDDFKIVLEYKLNDIDGVNKYFKGDEIVILKSRHKYFYDFDQYSFDIEKMKSVLDLKIFLQKYIESTLSHNFKLDVSLNENLYLNYLVKLYDKYTFDLYEKAIENNDIELIRSYILNFLSLLEQDEYLFYKYFQTKQNILQIYGTCGHIYAIEKANSLKSAVKMINLNERKQLVLDFLDLAEYFDKDISINAVEPIVDSSFRMPMQICDVKLDNFGLNKRNELKIIDTDMIHLDKMIFNGDVYIKHEDCHYFDCKSFCDPKTKMCEKKRVDNNLQVFCEKIFSNEYFPNDGLLSGITLTNDKFRNDLDKVLKKCIEPGYYRQNETDGEKKVKIATSFDVANEMQNLLRSNQFN